MFAWQNPRFISILGVLFVLTQSAPLIAQAEPWQVDSSFAPVLEGPTVPALPDAIVLQPNGKLLIAGRFNRINGVPVPGGYALARLLPSGATDPSFAATLASGDSISRLRLQPDGKIVALGRLAGSATAPVQVARFLAHGERDGSFTLDDGIPLNPEFPAFGQFSQLQLDASGFLYAVESYPTSYRTGGSPKFLRFTPDGARDFAFQTAIPVTSTQVFAPSPDGSVVTLDGRYSSPTIIRLGPDGAVDAGFIVDPNPFLFPSSAPLELVALPDNRTLAAGTIQNPYGEKFSYFLRLGREGNPDYRYVAPLEAGLNSSAAVKVWAGVLLDLLRDANASASATLQTGNIAVSAGGSCFAVTSDGLAKFVRTAASGPSVDPKPSLLSFVRPEFSTFARNQDENFSLSAIAGGLGPLAYQWLKDGTPVVGATSSTLELRSVGPSDAGRYSLVVSNAYGTATTHPATLAINLVTASPSILRHPESASVYSGPAYFSVEAVGNPAPSFEWFVNGNPFIRAGAVNSIGANAAGATASFVSLAPVVQPSDAGLYHAIARNALGRGSSSPAIVGPLHYFTKVVGAGAEVGPNISHPNGNVYDQVLLQGPAASITADAGEVTRLSFLDLTHDIVQVEFSGAGTLSLVLDSSTVSGPVAPLNYHQPGVSYMQGHAGIVITGANETTHVAVFSVGRVSAVDPTGAFDITQPIGAANDPARNGSTLFQGRPAGAYDGMADIAFIAISSTDGKFGGVRAGNTRFFATKGFTGLQAPGVQFTGPVNIGDIAAFDTALPVLVLGSANVTPLIVGGDLLQPNGEAVRLGSTLSLYFTAGATSHNLPLPAQTNQALFSRATEERTGAIAVTPSP